MHEKTKRYRMRAFVLVCAVAGICIANSGGLYVLPVRTESSTPGQVSLLARLSLAEFTACGVQKRVATPEIKTYRRKLPLAPPPLRNDIVQLDSRNQARYASQAVRHWHLAAVSPPSNRAPPRPAV